MKCLRCEGAMREGPTTTVKVGNHIPFMRGLEEMIEVHLKITIWTCEQCGKIEFFKPQPEAVVADEPFDIEDAEPWECPCGATNPGNEFNCAKCQKPRGYQIDP